MTTTPTVRDLRNLVAQAKLGALTEAERQHIAWAEQLLTWRADGRPVREGDALSPEAFKRVAGLVVLLEEAIKRTPAPAPTEPVEINGHKVAPDGSHCDCEGFKHRRRCKHCDQVLNLVGRTA